jgi:ATP-dependent RNA helicase HelY
VTDDRRLVRLQPQQFRTPPKVVGRIELPPSGGPRQSSYRRAVASALASVAPRGGGGDDAPPEPPPAEEERRASRIAQLRAEIREHPVHADERRAEIERWAARHDELAARTRRLERDIERRTGSLARALRRIVSVLSDLDYLEGPAEAPRPTADGLRLAALYVETGLLLAECVREGLLDDLSGPDLAAIASLFVHETRSKEPPLVRFPSPVVRERAEGITRRWETLSALEEEAGLTPTRPPDPGLAVAVWRWASGADLDDVLVDTDITGGDFVRGVKQIADLCHQIGAAYAGSPLGRQARRGADQLIRGVVAAD